MTTTTKILEETICPITGLPFTPRSRKQKMSEEGAAIKIKEDYRRRSQTKAGRARNAAAQRKWRATHPEHAKQYIKEYFVEYRKTNKWKEYFSQYVEDHSYSIVKRSKISNDDLEKLRSIQGNRCAISGETENLCIDHSHFDGRIRGIICNRCNVGLGIAQDNSVLLRNLAELVERDLLPDVMRNELTRKILGRFPTPELLRAAADYIENPPFSRIKKDVE